MRNKTLVDTTIWIEFFRGRSRMADHLEILLKENLVLTCGIVLFEVLRGIKSEDEKNIVLGILSGLPYIEMTKRLWQNAAELSIALKRNGVILPLSDIFIAAIAIENELPVFTLDRHFSQIPNLKLYKI